MLTVLSGFDGTLKWCKIYFGYERELLMLACAAVELWLTCNVVDKMRALKESE